ncbi:MAG: MATE family efflux transporter [Ruminococcaceae bacterium]|nr:MATE family efflux transporter [Oscillospiraceae bacterium]
MNNKQFYKQFILISIPMGLQNLLTTMVNLVDNLMIGRLGDVAVAAVGLANKVFFLYTLVVFGLCSGATAFVSQYWGKGDLKGIKRVMLINMIGSFVFSLAFAIAGSLFPGEIMKLLTNDPLVIKEGMGYIRIIAPGFLVTGIIYVFSYILKALEHPKVPLIASIVSILVNTVINYILIFGKFGFPKLGVLGAAFGTLIARIFEVTVILAFSVKKLDFVFTRFYEYKGITKAFLKQFAIKVTPVIINESSWALATTIMISIFAKISTQAVAALNVINILRDLTGVFFIGTGLAAGVMLGKLIGLKRYEETYERTLKLSVVLPLISFLIAIATYLLSPMFLNLFNISAEAKEIAKGMYLVATVCMPVSAFNYLNICGSLRSGGDSLFCLLTDSVTIWTVGVFGSLIGANIGLPVIAVYIISRTEELVKGTVVLIRIIKKKWIKDLVN